MLTGRLLLYARRGGRLIPRRLDPADGQLLAGAEALLQLFAAFQGRRRGELEEALRDVALPGMQTRVAQGLAKLLMDRCEFEMGAAAEPVALRRDLFEAAAQAWRHEGSAQLPRWRERVIGQVGSAHGLTSPQVEQVLYADLAENHVFAVLRPIAAGDLLYRYNAAQVQGLLLRAARITLTCPSWPSPQRLRQLFRSLKFHGLLFHQEPGSLKNGAAEQGGATENGGATEQGGATAEAFALVLDGPLSVLEEGSRYGMKLAQFLPALFHWKQPWKLECRLSPRPGSAEGLLELEPHPFLKSHYPDQGQWVAEEVRQFVAGFNALGGVWRAAPATELVALRGNRYLIPDFVFRPQGAQGARGGYGGPGGEVFLEVLRYPSRDQLARRMELVETNGLDNYIVACKGLPSLRELAMESEAVFVFRRTLLPGQMQRFLGNRRQQGF